MKKKLFEKKIIKGMIPFVFVIVLLSVSFQACQKDEMVEPENVTLKSTVIPEITVNYPDEVSAGEDFDITYSSSCGKIMLERGYILEYEDLGNSYKVYSDLTCETENLQWESVEEDVYKTCAGKTVTENIEYPGTYVYRVKLNMKAIRQSSCEDCAELNGNQFKCFMVTVAECIENIFKDPRDNHVYRMVTIGNQTWMAENLAYDAGEGCYAYNNNEDNVATYGRLYTWDAAQTAAPDGWHIATETEWTTLFIYLTTNVTSNTAKALASTEGWDSSSNQGAPGNEPTSNNSSGFNAIPAGERDGYYFYSMGRFAYWWTGTEADYSTGKDIWISYADPSIVQQNKPKTFAYSVRCVKD